METRQLHQFEFRAHRLCFLLCFFHLFLTPNRQQLIPLWKKEFFSNTFFAADTNISFFAVCSCSPYVSYCRSFSPASHAPDDSKSRMVYSGANEWWREKHREHKTVLLSLSRVVVRIGCVLKSSPAHEKTWKLKLEIIITLVRSNWSPFSSRVCLWAVMLLPTLVKRN